MLLNLFCFPDFKGPSFFLLITRCPNQLTVVGVIVVAVEVVSVTVVVVLAAKMVAVMTEMVVEAMWRIVVEEERPKRLNASTH